MLRMFGLLDLLEAHCNTAAGEPLCIYGDPAYPLRYLQSPYRDGNLSDEQRASNSSMSSVRVSVEWVFGDITRYFAFVNFKHNLKIGLEKVPLARYILFVHCSGMLLPVFMVQQQVHFLTLPHQLFRNIFKQICKIVKCLVIRH